MTTTDSRPGHEPSPLLWLGCNEGLGPAPGRADVDAVMTLVWALVPNGPNFDGRQVDVQRAVAAAIDNAVAAERERCAKVAEDFLTKGRSPLGRSVAAAIRVA